MCTAVQGNHLTQQSSACVYSVSAAVTASYQHHTSCVCLLAHLSDEVSPDSVAWVDAVYSNVLKIAC
jgi:hypothetical protein